MFGSSFTGSGLLEPAGSGGKALLVSFFAVVAVAVCSGDGVLVLVLSVDGLVWVVCAKPAIELRLNAETKMNAVVMREMLVILKNLQKLHDMSG
jgi:hypothetical protein